MPYLRQSKQPLQTKREARHLTIDGPLSSGSCLTTGCWPPVAVSCHAGAEVLGARAKQADIRTRAASTGWKRCDDYASWSDIPAERTVVQDITREEVLSQGHNVAMLLYERQPRQAIWLAPRSLQRGPAL